MHTCMHRNTHLPVWVGLKDRDSVSYSRWLQGLGQRASMDGKTTTAAKAERTEMEKDQNLLHGSKVEAN